MEKLPKRAQHHHAQCVFNVPKLPKSNKMAKCRIIIIIIIVGRGLVLQLARNSASPLYFSFLNSRSGQI
jgi:hypothetical protein